MNNEKIDQNKLGDICTKIENDYMNFLEDMKAKYSTEIGLSEFAYRLIYMVTDSILNLAPSKEIALRTILVAVTSATENSE